MTGRGAKDRLDCTRLTARAKGPAWVCAGRELCSKAAPAKWKLSCQNRCHCLLLDAPLVDLMAIDPVLPEHIMSLSRAQAMVFELGGP